ncbi:hypothetical protein PS1_026360 [Malus domestica]
MASSSLRQAIETGNASSLLTFQPETQSSGDGIELLACPVCYEPLIRKGPLGLKSFIGKQYSGRLSSARYATSRITAVAGAKRRTFTWILLLARQIKGVHCAQSRRDWLLQKSPRFLLVRKRLASVFWPNRLPLSGSRV